MKKKEYPRTHTYENVGLQRNATARRERRKNCIEKPSELRIVKKYLCSSSVESIVRRRSISTFQVLTVRGSNCSCSRRLAGPERVTRCANYLCSLCVRLLSFLFFFFFFSGHSLMIGFGVAHLNIRHRRVQQLPFFERFPKALC